MKTESIAKMALLPHRAIPAQRQDAGLHNQERLSYSTAIEENNAEVDPLWLARGQLS